jgi:hypothetical protein
MSSLGTRANERRFRGIGIGGTIGTALYVQIGRSLINGGPGALFIAFTLWCTVICAVTVCKSTVSPLGVEHRVESAACLTSNRSYGGDGHVPPHLVPVHPLRRPLR